MSSSTPGGAALWDSIVAKSEAEKGNWTAKLRAAGVKLAHPDDGWVKRDINHFSLSWYAQFDDQPEEGDLIAFGCPPGEEHYRSHQDVWRGRRDRYARDRMARLKDLSECAWEGYRICRVTKVERRHSILGYFQDFDYEDTGVRLPPRKPTRLRRWFGRK